jgi:chromosome segregation ATPase
MKSNEIEPSSYKEWTLTQNLKDAESLIQDLKSEQAEIRQKMFDSETALKKKDVEF